MNTPPDGGTAAPHVEVSRRLVLLNSAGTVLSQAVQISVLVWLQQYLLGRISTEEYSLYPVVMAVVIFAPLLTIALTSGLRRYTVEAYARGDEVGVTRIVSSMFPLLAAIAGFILVVGLGLSWQVSVVLEIPADRVWDARLMLALMMVLAALRVVLAPFGLGLYIRQKFVWFQMIQLGTQLLRLALLCVLLFGVSTRVLWVVVATVLAEGTGLLVTHVISRRLVPALRFRTAAFDRTRVGSLLSFSGWAVVYQLALTLNQAAAPLVLNRLATAMDVTCFYLGSLAWVQIQRTAQWATMPVQPALTALHAHGNRDAIARACIQGNRYALWAVLALTVPLVVYRDELISLYVGPEYLEAAVAMTCLLGSLPFVYSQFMLGRLAVATVGLRQVATRSIVHQIATIGLMVYLVGPRGMGASGAALAVFGTAVVVHPLWMWPLGRELGGFSGRRWVRETVWPGMLPAICGGVVWLALQVVVRPDSWVALGLCAVAGGAAYLVALVVFALDAGEREELRGVLRRLTT